MLAAFVIALREGVEAALIVGIVAAFLARAGRRDGLRSMWTGVAAAVVLCVAVAVVLQIVDAELPERGQEGLETIVALVATGFVTFMVVWMRRHARGLKAQLERGAASALAEGSTAALVAMAFFAVLREGLETSVFMLAVLQQQHQPLAAGGGALLGLLVAVAIGYGLYRGGVRINLSRFFRATGLVLVLVAAGLLASAVHSAQEVGWITGLTGQALDLRWLVSEGSVHGSLLTGLFGVHPTPSTGELVAWLAYAIPVGAYVAWPARRRPWRGVVADTA